MASKTSLVGRVFDRLSVIEGLNRSNRSRNCVTGFSHYKCLCECGSVVVVASFKLSNGNTRSCGCFRRGRAASLCASHGKSYTRLYRTWCGMKERTLNPFGRSYAAYGGRGIAFWNAWLDFNVFYEWAMANGYQDDLTIDRIDNDKGYSPNNCRWTTVLTQSNNRRSSVHVTIFGETKTVSQWVADSRCEVARTTFQRNMKEHGLSPEKSLQKRGGK